MHPRRSVPPADIFDPAVERCLTPSPTDFTLIYWNAGIMVSALLPAFGQFTAEGDGIDGAYGYPDDLSHDTRHWQ